MLRFEIGHREGGQKIGRTFEPDGQTNTQTNTALYYIDLFTYLTVLSETPHTSSSRHTIQTQNNH